MLIISAADLCRILLRIQVTAVLVSSQYNIFISSPTQNPYQKTAFNIFVSGMV